MVTFGPELNLMLNNFAELEENKERGAKESLAYQHLVESLEQSEALLKATEQAIEEDKLNHFNLIAEHKAGAASYAAESKTVNFKLSTLEDTQHKADIVFIFGHEVGHANNYYLSQSLREGFKSRAEALSQQEGIRDYTSLVQEVLEDHARDEGLSQFAGWNALVSNLRKDNPNLTLQDIYATEGNFKLRFFNDDGQLKDGYQINANLSFDLTSENMAAVKEHFFETIRNTSGKGDAGYRDMYSRRYIEEHILSLEKGNPVKGTPTLDMEKLGLSPQRSLEIQKAIKTLKTPEQARELEQEQTLEKNELLIENKMIGIDLAAKSPFEAESPELELAKVQNDLVLRQMMVTELEQQLAELSALTAQVLDQDIEKKQDPKIDLLEFENKEILLTMTATGMSFNINGKDHDASYFNQLKEGMTETRSTYRNETNTLLARYEYESDQFSIFHKNPYGVDKIAVISDFSEQNTINLVSFDAVKTKSLEKQKGLGIDIGIER